MISIKQNSNIPMQALGLAPLRSASKLPDFRNLGICLRILVIVNFVVITKGSGRIAEVAARFSLFELTINPDNAMQYQYGTDAEGRPQWRDISAETVTIKLGTLAPAGSNAHPANSTGLAAEFCVRGVSLFGVRVLGRDSACLCEHGVTRAAARHRV